MYSIKAKIHPHKIEIAYKGSSWTTSRLRLTARLTKNQLGSYSFIGLRYVLRKKSNPNR